MELLGVSTTIRRKAAGEIKPVPSDDREAPESLKSSVPIWMGKTRSWGRILGILDIDASVCSLGGVLKSGEVSIASSQRPKPHDATRTLAGELKQMACAGSRSTMAGQWSGAGREQIEAWTRHSLRLAGRQHGDPKLQLGPAVSVVGGEGDGEANNTGCACIRPQAGDPSHHGLVQGRRLRDASSVTRSSSPRRLF